MGHINLLCSKLLSLHGTIGQQCHQNVPLQKKMGRGGCCLCYLYVTRSKFLQITYPDYEEFCRLAVW